MILTDDCYHTIEKLTLRTYIVVHYQRQRHDGGGGLEAILSQIYTCLKLENKSKSGRK